MADYLSKEEFREFLNNDFSHLVQDVSSTKSKVSTIQGMLAILVPMTIAILVLLLRS